MQVQGKMAHRRARVIAFYLPQFHPISENDEWWGPGFTEWINVAKARALFRGHQAQSLPGELGFYDLRLAETRIAQADLARKHGIESFCYWHYWFGNGKRILERPFNEVLRSGVPDFGFCLAWANLSWTSIWRGKPGTVLIKQEYFGDDDHKSHFQTLLPAFRDQRYTRVNGKPLFLVYSPFDLPDTENFVGLWQGLARDAGLPGLHLVAMCNNPNHSTLRFSDGVTMFGPGDYIIRQSRIFRALHYDLGPTLGRFLKHCYGPARYDYLDVANKCLKAIPDSERFYPGVISNWDNTPRSGKRGIVFTGATPKKFGDYLKRGISRVESRDFDHRIVFLKAWNEWAEGNYIEPDRKYGRGWLEAVSDAVFIDKQCVSNALGEET